MKIQAIYDQYEIMPILQLHMRRVAAVVKLICDHLDVGEDIDNLYKAALLHDIGNIVKFNLAAYPEHSQPEGEEHWRDVQRKTIAKYGEYSRTATWAIITELGVSERVKELVSSVGFINAAANAVSSDIAKKICCYADQRVEIDRVTDLKTRLAEGRKRFLMGREASRDVGLEHGSKALLAIEAEIMTKAHLDPSTITDESVNQLLAAEAFESLEI